jgi:hypothetical protein
MNEYAFLAKYPKQPDAWQTKLQAKCNLPFPLPWLLVGVACFFVGFALRSLLDDAAFDLRSIAIQSALIAAIANSVIYYERILDEAAVSIPHLLRAPAEGVEEWLDHWYGYIFWSSRNIYAGLVLAAICVANGFAGGAPEGSTASLLYHGGLSAIVGFLGGSMFWAMIGVARMTSSLGRSVEIRASIFDSQTSTLKVASSLIWKVALTASVVYLLGVSGFFVGEVEMNASIYVVAVGFGIFVMVYFIAPQANIHGTLVQLKRERLHALVDQIDNTFDQVAAEPTPANITQLRDLFDLQKTLNGKASWTFGIKELIMLLGTVCVPLFVILVDRLIGD